MKEKIKEDCLSCKVISICTFTGIGGYLIYLSRRQSPVSKYSMVAIGIGAAGIGVGEMFNKSIF